MKWELTPYKTQMSWSTPRIWDALLGSFCNTHRHNAFNNFPIRYHHRKRRLKSKPKKTQVEVFESNWDLRVIVLWWSVAFHREKLFSKFFPLRHLSIIYNSESLRISVWGPKKPQNESPTTFCHQTISRHELKTISYRDERQRRLPRVEFQDRGRDCCLPERLLPPPGSILDLPPSSRHHFDRCSFSQLPEIATSRNWNSKHQIKWITGSNAENYWKSMTNSC